MRVSSFGSVAFQACIENVGAVSHADADVELLSRRMPLQDSIGICTHGGRTLRRRVGRELLTAINSPADDPPRACAMPCAMLL